MHIHLLKYNKIHIRSLKKPLKLNVMSKSTVDFSLIGLLFCVHYWSIGVFFCFLVYFIFTNYFQVWLETTYLVPHIYLYFSVISKLKVSLWVVDHRHCSRHRVFSSFDLRH